MGKSRLLYINTSIVDTVHRLTLSGYAFNADFLKNWLKTKAKDSISVFNLKCSLFRTNYVIVKKKQDSRLFNFTFVYAQ